MRFFERITRQHRLLGFAYIGVIASYILRPDSGAWLALKNHGGNELVLLLVIGLFYSALHLTLSEQVKSREIIFVSLPFFIYHLAGFTRAISVSTVPINANAIYVGVWLLPLLSTFDTMRAYRALAAIVVTTGVLIELRPFGVVALITDIFSIPTTMTSLIFIVAGLVLLLMRERTALKLVLAIAPLIYLVIFTILHVSLQETVPFAILFIFTTFLAIVLRFAYEVERVYINELPVSISSD